MSQPNASSRQTHSLPVWLKMSCCALMAFHLYANLTFYGPLNYLWFCDIGLVTATVAICIESPLLLSMTAVSVMGPTVGWSIDFLIFAVSGRYPIGIASYMSDGQIPMLVRTASMFHILLPSLLIWTVSRLGYDRRAIIYQTVFAVTLLIICRTLTDPPPPRSARDVVNINSVYGNSDVAPQTQFPAWVCRCTTHLPAGLQITRQTHLSAWVYVSWIVVKFWFGMYLPTHVAACLLFDRRREAHRARSDHGGTAASSLPS